MSKLVVNEIENTDGEAAFAPTLLTEVAVGVAGATSASWTGIPSWVTTIKVILYRVSTSGINDLILQVGDSGGTITSGYRGSCGTEHGSGVAATTFTTSFTLVNDALNAETYTGVTELVKQQDDGSGGARWVLRSQLGIDTTGMGIFMCSGLVNTTFALSDVIITTSGGTDTFDSGRVSLSYE